MPGFTRISSGAASTVTQTGAKRSRTSELRALSLDSSSAVGQYSNDDTGVARMRNGADASPQRVLRTSQDRPLAEGGYALVPGEGRGYLCLRSRNSGSLDQFQAAVGHPPPSLHQDQA